MFRTLTHFWRINLAVVLGAAVASAVLTGALLVGDSVRASLRDLVLERLGRIDAALVAERFFREELAGDIMNSSKALDSSAGIVPAVLLRGSAVDTDAGTRASRVGIQGIDERFARLFEEDLGRDLERGPGQIFPSVMLNGSLARELQADVGDSVLLHFGRASDVPRDSLMGEKDADEVVGLLRGTVTRILADEGMGGFGLAPDQHRALNAFVDLGTLQKALDRRGEVNALLAHGRDVGGDLAPAVGAGARLEDIGLKLFPEADHVRLESREFVLRPDVDRAARKAIGDLGRPMIGTQSYLANRITAGDRALPYSMVVAVDPLEGHAWSALRLADGSTASAASPGGILLGSWAAEDLGVAVGDEIRMDYFVVGPREELSVRTSEFHVDGIVAMRDLGADRELTPEYPGIQDADDMTDWDPPFPVDLSSIREKDEAYWDEYGATPKAFVAASTGRELWNTRFGTTTSIRIGPAAGESVEQLAERVRSTLLAALPPESFGLRFRTVRQDGLAASSGATDFGGLFIAFSFFLILSAAMLIGLLFGLGIEQRAREIGLRLAVGQVLGNLGLATLIADLIWPPRWRRLFGAGYWRAFLSGLIWGMSAEAGGRTIRSRLFAEGGLLAAIGAALGLVGGVGYAALLMAALRGMWQPAVGSSRLFLHVQPSSLILGWVISLAVILFTIGWSLRRLRKIPSTALLAGSSRPRASRRRTRVAVWIGSASTATAGGLVTYAAWSGSLASPGLAFGTGALLLIAGLAFFTAWCRGASRRAIRPGPLALVEIAARNSSWSPGRSVLSVALVACASFVIVTVAANRHEFGDELQARDSGSGGFALTAEADVPIHRDLGSTEGLFDLGFSSLEAESLADVGFYPLRLMPGDDASCLNLYRPEKPRILGVPEDLVRRGGFRFQQSIELPEGAASPWDLLDRPIEDGVIPAIADFNSATWILKLGLGQDLEIEDELGNPLRLRLVATLQSSILQSELLISEKSFLEAFPGRTGYGYFLIEAPFDESEEVSRLLESRLGSFGLDISTSIEKLSAYKVVENTYLATFQVLGGLGLLLGTVGLAVVLVRNVVERRGELATLRAFGFRRGQLAWMVLAENAFLLMLGIAIGGASALIAVAPRLTTIHVPWGSLALTLALVVAIGMLSSVAAVAGALRVPLLPALKADR